MARSKGVDVTDGRGRRGWRPGGRTSFPVVVFVGGLVAAGCTLGNPTAARNAPAVVHARQVVAELRTTLEQDRAAVRLSREGPERSGRVGSADGANLIQARAQLRSDRSELKSARLDLRQAVVAARG